MYVLAQITKPKHNKGSITYRNDVSESFSFKPSAIAIAPASPIWLLLRLHTTNVCVSTNKKTKTQQRQYYLPQGRQRVVLLQAIGNRNRTSVANLVVMKATHNKCMWQQCRLSLLLLPLRKASRLVRN
jgi:hypothetical protein